MPVKILVTSEDVTPEILRNVEDTLDWFEDQPGLNTEEFIDRLCSTYAVGSLDEDGWDIEDYTVPAVRKIMRHARAAKKAATT